LLIPIIQRLFRKRFEAALYRLVDVLQSLLGGIPLRMAARQRRTTDDVPPFLGLFESHLEFHGRGLASEVENVFLRPPGMGADGYLYLLFSKGRIRGLALVAPNLKDKKQLGEEREYYRAISFSISAMASSKEIASSQDALAAS